MFVLGCLSIHFELFLSHIFCSRTFCSKHVCIVCNGHYAYLYNSQNTVELPQMVPSQQQPSPYKGQLSISPNYYIFDLSIEATSSQQQPLLRYPIGGCCREIALYVHVFMEYILIAHCVNYKRHMKNNITYQSTEEKNCEFYINLHFFSYCSIKLKIVSFHQSC